MLPLDALVDQSLNLHSLDVVADSFDDFGDCLFEGLEKLGERAVVGRHDTLARVGLLNYAHSILSLRHQDQLLLLIDYVNGLLHLLLDRVLLQKGELDFSVQVEQD